VDGSDLAAGSTFAPGVRTGGGAAHQLGVGSGAGSGGAAGAPCHQPPSGGGATGSTGIKGNMSETCCEAGSLVSAGAACSAGSSGTMSATEPERWPLSAGGWRRELESSATRRSAATVKIFRQAGLGQRIDCPRSEGCTW
jgi:hypothetical protein